MRGKFDCLFIYMSLINFYYKPKIHIQSYKSYLLNQCYFYKLILYLYYIDFLLIYYTNKKNLISIYLLKNINLNLLTKKHKVYTLTLTSHHITSHRQILRIIPQPSRRTTHTTITQNIRSTTRTIKTVTATV